MLYGFCVPAHFTQFACIECKQDLPLQTVRLAHLQVAWASYNYLRNNNGRHSERFVQDLMHAKWKILILNNGKLKTALQELAAHPAAHHTF